MPWKIQCPNCRRKFPSNDFASFYASGIDEHGVFNLELAHANGQQYLKNIEHPEFGEGWGVDDGFGYKTGNVFSNDVVESKTFIAYYIHYGLWQSSGSNNPGLLTTALSNLRDAYLFTGEAKYGRVGAILIDRVADVYPEFNLYPYFGTFYNSHGNSGEGKIIGRIWECALARNLAQAYDAFYPAMEDPYVINFLSKKAETYGLDNKKKTSEMIRQNCEDGILRAIYEGCKTASINGNFGMHQQTLAVAAVTLDSMPETKEWIDWILQQGSRSSQKCSGGNVLPQLVDLVSRDGIGDEAGANYNVGWLNSIMLVADELYGYDRYPAANLYANPKFAKMFSGLMPLTLCSRATAQIGDSGRCAGIGINQTTTSTIMGFSRLRDPLLAQMTYMLNGNSNHGIHEDIFTKNPEKIAQDIQKVIDEHGELILTSDQLPGYGFTILRDGEFYQAEVGDKVVDTQRDFWLYYGRGVAHGHPDALNLGIEAYGINMAPDLGYPEATGGDPNRQQWVANTISHNTVVVNEKMQSGLATNGTPMHFDDAGRVKLMDVDAARVYDETDIYRRTVVMVEYDDEVSYGLDFFRVKGGDDHLYSFHSQSNQVDTQGLEFVEQKLPVTGASGEQVMEWAGTYAGIDVPWGVDNHGSAGGTKYPLGYTWLDQIRRDQDIAGKYNVDFRINDFKNVLPYPMDLHLNVTMLNTDLSEVTLARGTPPRLAGNPKELTYLLARRKGKDLDTLFTTVFEPYKETRYIQAIDAATETPAAGMPFVERKEGADSVDDRIRVVRVTLTGGRVDYIVYATDCQAAYTIYEVRDVDGTLEKTPLFDFSGFVGVYTTGNGEFVASYLNDGTQIGSQETIAAYTGKVESFTRELAFENQITVSSDQPMDLEELTGRFIYVDNDGTQNAAYPIMRAESTGEGSTTLYLGNNTLIRSYKDSTDVNGGYLYNIAEGQSFRIPLSNAYDTAPIFAPVPKQNAIAGSKYQLTVNAYSPVDKEITYREKDLPRGAQFDPETRQITWKPDGGQIGMHSIAIEATDGSLSSTLRFQIQVYKGSSATNGGSSDNQGNHGNSGETEKEDEGSNNGDEEHGDGSGNGGNQGDPSDSERFTDLAGYEWARDSINRLAQQGIINGTSPNTYAPGKNITRADFTVLLVRAFRLRGQRRRTVCGCAR